MKPVRGKRYCSDKCRLVAWAARQKPIDFTPPAVARIPLTAPAHDPGKRAALHRAARHVLELLQDGQPHSRHELQTVGGNRYVARIAAIRDALAGRAVVLGPLPQPRRGVFEVEPMRDGCECYRLEWRA